MKSAPYHTLGNTGLRVSPLALGTMTFGTDWGWGSEKDVARNIFNAYVETGGNFFDTADLYTNGASEIWLGEFIKESKLRDKAIITTKFSFNADPQNPNAGGNGRKNILRALEGSLKRLNTDYIDLYLLHVWDQITPVEEVMRTMDDLVTAGKVRHIGFSNVPAWYASRAQTIAQFRGCEPVSVLQLEYSLVERGIENEYIPLGIQQGMGVMVWSPLASGLLSGKYKQSKDGKFGEGRLQTVANSGNPAFAKFTPHNFAIVAELEKVAKEIDRSMAQVALNWTLHRPGIASVILGATKLAQLTDNIGALDFEIPPELYERLTAVSNPEPRYPYLFFSPEMQAMVHGANPVGDKREGYALKTRIEAKAAGLS